jgi:hypothetical protein
MFLETNPHGNEKFCTRPSQTTSCSDGKEYLYQVPDGSGLPLISHPYLMMRLKKCQSYNFTPLVGFHGVELDKVI